MARVGGVDLERRFRAHHAQGDEPAHPPCNLKKRSSRDAVQRDRQPAAGAARLDAGSAYPAAQGGAALLEGGFPEPHHARARHHSAAGHLPLRTCWMTGRLMVLCGTVVPYTAF